MSFLCSKMVRTSSTTAPQYKKLPKEFFVLGQKWSRPSCDRHLTCPTLGCRYARCQFFAREPKLFETGVYYICYSIITTAMKKAIQFVFSLVAMLIGLYTLFNHVWLSPISLLGLATLLLGYLQFIPFCPICRTLCKE